MRVRVTLTLDIDREAWATEYGIDRTGVRDDVRAYVESSVREHLRNFGLLADA